MILCAIGATEIILICVVILLLFGGKKVPELMKGVGQGVRQFKKGLNLEEESPVSLTAEEKYAERERIKEEITKEKEKEAQE